MTSHRTARGRYARAITQHYLGTAATASRELGLSPTLAYELAYLGGLPLTNNG